MTDLQAAIISAINIVEGLYDPDYEFYYFTGNEKKAVKRMAIRGYLTIGKRMGEWKVTEYGMSEYKKHVRAKNKDSCIN